jgi:hypothetical protein
MKYKDNDEVDEKLMHHVNHMTMHKEDVDRHTLDHKHNKDLEHFKKMDEGY